MNKQPVERTILILKGLPASGKSTYAKELATKPEWKRVNKDELRAMIDNSHWSKTNEKFIVEMRDMLISFAMLNGFNVIVDDTNFAPQHLEDIKKTVAMFNNDPDSKIGIATTSIEPLPHYTIKTIFFDTPLEVCFERNRNRNKKLKQAGLPALVTNGVIQDMYNRYLANGQVIVADDIITPPENEVEEVKAAVYVPPEGKPTCILVDIDGTLAHMNGKRSPYDWHKVGVDDLDEIVSNEVKHYWNRGHNNVMDETTEPKIIILSGRDGICRPETEEWLAKHSIQYDKLLMREAGDSRKDNIVKREIFENEIRNNYRVLFVLDDRNQVVDMWRNEVGLKVFQVAEGDF
jgi:predicted kinase